MPGPPPKDPSQRRRRNAEVRTAIPNTPYSGPRPKLPKSWKLTTETLDGTVTKTVPFLAPTRAWFETWATSPQAHAFTATDWQRLIMIASLVDRLHRGIGAPGPLMAEIRLNETGLGALAADRARLRWDLTDVTDEVAEKRTVTGSRARLKAVDPSAA